MIRIPMFSTIALGTVLVTGAFMTAGVASAVPACPAGVVCQGDGQMHSRPPVNSGSGMQNSGDNQSMDWKHRHRRHFGSNDVGVGIYVNTGGDGYGHRWHHRRHCKVVKIWRHHHPVWVKKCFWPHY